MKYKSSFDHDFPFGVRPLCAASLVCVGTLLGFPVSAETQFEPRLGITGTWLDNIALASQETGKEEEYIGQVTPGVRLEREGQRIDTFLDYQAQALFYESDSDRNEVFHQGNLDVGIEAVREWFFIDIDGRYAQSIVDPRQPSNRNNLFAVGNLVDTAAATVTSALRHDFGSVKVNADYTRGFVDYRGPADDTSVAVTSADSDNEEANFALGSSAKDARLTWGTRYHFDNIEYDQAQSFEYERADAELGLKVAQALRLIGRGGVETDPFADIADGGLDESFWEAGFSWSRGERREFRALVGERFFGTSYEVLLRVAGRVMSLELGYDEKPTTESQQFALARQASPTDPQPLPEPTFGRVEPQAYLLRRFHGQLAATGRFTEITLDVSSEEREYVLLAGAEDRFQLGTLNLSRKFGPRTTGELGASVVKGHLREGGDYDEQSYVLSLSRALGRQTSVIFTGNHLERSGDLQDYDANWISLGVQMIF